MSNDITDGVLCFSFFSSFFFYLHLIWCCAYVRACVRSPCCDFQYGHHLEIGLRQGAEGLRLLCGAIYFLLYSEGVNSKFLDISSNSVVWHLVLLSKLCLWHRRQPLHIAY